MAPPKLEVPADDLAGQRIGRREVLRFVGWKVLPAGKRTSLWEVKCDCGTVQTVTRTNWSCNKRESCGCLTREASSARLYKHGRSKTREHSIWVKVVARCTYPKHRDYGRYGGRGITICDRWRLSFPDFLADVGPSPGDGYSLDRIDNDGHYEPGNVRWATATEQGRNRRSNRLITHGGSTKTLAEWAEATGLSASIIRHRLVDLKWPADRALTEPKRESRRKPRSARMGASEYDIWAAMCGRCRNPNHRQYADYGGRGISVCDRWAESYDAFLADVGPRPSPTHSLDRVDVNNGYCPGNCRWATREEQASNTRRSRILEFNGERDTLSGWCRRVGLSVPLVHQRLALGWPVERALTTPVRACTKS